MYQKKTRVVNESLLKHVRQKPCDGCGKHSTKNSPNQAAHIKTRGSGGDDKPYNLLSLCVFCHHEQHLKGWRKFLENREFLRQKLWQMGWRIDGFGKMSRD